MSMRHHMMALYIFHQFIICVLICCTYGYMLYGCVILLHVVSKPGWKWNETNQVIEGAIEGVMAGKYNYFHIDLLQ